MQENFYNFVVIPSCKQNKFKFLSLEEILNIPFIPSTDFLKSLWNSTTGSNIDDFVCDLA